MKAEKWIDPDDRTNFKICFMCYGQIYLSHILDYEEFTEENYLCRDCQLPFLRRIYKPGVEITNTVIREGFGLPVL